VALRFRRGSAPLGQPQHLEFGDDSLQRQADAIADADAVRGLDPLGVQMHLASGDRGAGQGAGFVKSRIPEPFVQAMDLGFVVRFHAATIA
jgi:hypothetical protein